MDWEELRNRLLSEQRTTIHACVAWDDGDVPAMSFMGSHYRWGPGPRCMASDDDGEPRPAVLEFWRQGRKVRVEVSGRPVYITDGVQVWDFRGDAARPVVLTARTVSFARALDYSGAAQWLVRRPPAGRWIDDDVRPETPVDEDVLEGRSTWTFVIGETRVWVDTVSLHVLALQSVGSTYREKTVAPDIGVPLDDDLFTWGGPTTSPRDHRKSREAERERKKRQRIAGIRRWFVENVVEDDSDLEALPVTVDLTPTSVPRVSEETGEFVARGDDMELSRHIPGSDFRYEEDRAAHRWSALGYDWQLILWAEVVLGRAGIEEVWDQLHPGAEVTSYRPPGQRRRLAQQGAEDLPDLPEVLDLGEQEVRATGAAEDQDEVRAGQRGGCQGGVHHRPARRHPGVPVGQCTGLGDRGLGQLASVVLGGGGGRGHTAGLLAGLQDDGPLHRHRLRQRVDQFLQAVDGAVPVPGEFGQQADLAASVDRPGERADRVDEHPVDLLCRADERVGQAAGGKVDDDIVDDGAVRVVLHDVHAADIGVDGAQRGGNEPEGAGDVGEPDAHQIGQGVPQRKSESGRPDCSEPG
jgi:hypothetical protein